MVFDEGVVHSPVRAAGAHHRGTSRHSRCFSLRFRDTRNRDSFGKERFPDGFLAELADSGEQALAGYLNAQRPDMVFQDRIKLFNHIQFLDLCGKIADQLFRQRIGHADLQHAHGSRR